MDEVKNSTISDLLSAALNQSGLVNETNKTCLKCFLPCKCNQEEDILTNDDENIKQETTSSKSPKRLCNEILELSKPISRFSSHTIPLSTFHPTIVLKYNQVASLPKTKIIKLPTLKPGSIIKIQNKALPNTKDKNKISKTMSFLKVKEASISANLTVMSNSTNICKVLNGNETIALSKITPKSTDAVIMKNLNSNHNVLVKSVLNEAVSCQTTELLQTKPSFKHSNNIDSPQLNLGSIFVKSAERTASVVVDTLPPPLCDLTSVEEKFSCDDCLDESRELNNKLYTKTKLDKCETSSFNDILKKNTLFDDQLVVEDEEELLHAQTYSEYIPSKFKSGLPHPDSVVETSSLASIIPPDIDYELTLPKHIVNLGYLSALQLESVVYACQKHETYLQNGVRAGFLIGDGPGVGKGRSLAGIIFENYLVGRKRAIWFSVSNDLRFDAERDLSDIGAKHIKVYSLNKFKYGKITSKNNGAIKKGVIFATYSSLIGESHSQAKYHTRLKQLLHWCGKDFDGLIIFDECHKAKNLLPSGPGKSTKTALTVLKLQNQLPNARVVYASATGASEPRNMAYMSRLGLWGPGTSFNDFFEFVQVLEHRGVGAMELVAMDMKLRGCYIARQLSFYGVSFKTEEIKLEPSFIIIYNKCVQLWVAARKAFEDAAALMEAEFHMKKSMWGQFWSAHQRFFKYLCLSAKVKHTVRVVREAVKHGKCVVIGIQSTGEAGMVDQLEKQGGELDNFVSTAKTVFENLIEHHFPAPDRNRVVALLGRNLYRTFENENNQVKKRKINSENQAGPSKKSKKISESLNESLFQLDDEASFSDSSVSSEEDITKIFGHGSDSDDLSDMDTAENNIKILQDEHHVVNVMKDDSVNFADEKEDALNIVHSLEMVSGTVQSFLPGIGPVEKAQSIKKELLARFDVLGHFLPNNMLDELIDALGGTENVAEMTGRKGRVVAMDNGNIQYQSRAENDIPVEFLNLKEKQRFMDGEKNIAIISEAASSGISLQADKRVRNQRKRLHVTLELPWSADKAVQQFGRTHRSNQVNAPEYLFLITELAGEQRFASIVAKRLESLGALTHGDRHATESRDLSKYNYDNKYGKKALDSVMKAIAGHETPLVSPPQSYNGNFFEDVRQGLLGVGLLMQDPGHFSYILDKDYNNIFKFMNRILGMEVEQQNALFAFFADTLTALINEAKRLGVYDQGIMDVGSANNLYERVKYRDFLLNSGECISLHTIKVERGTSWNEAIRLHQENIHEKNSGFYLSMQKRNGRPIVMLALKCTSNKHHDLMLIYRPNTGKQTRRENLCKIQTKYLHVDPEKVESWWNDQYHAFLNQCSHAYWQGSCSHDHISFCHIGKRRHLYHVLSGSVLKVWKIVENVLSDCGCRFKMQIVRLKIPDGVKLVGLLIPSICVNKLTIALNRSFVHHISDFKNHCDRSDTEESDFDEVDDINPDAMLSSVLFSKKDFLS